MTSHTVPWGVQSNADNHDVKYAAGVEARKRQEAAHHARCRVVQAGMLDDLNFNTAEDYQDDIIEHMHHMEAETMPDVNSIDIQTEIQWYMRPYLIDFLVEAHAAFGLVEETLFLTVNLLDRYCSKRVVYKRHYQLVGCAALLIAAKYGDRKDRVPTMRELKSMCCSLYEEEMFTQMEWHVLATLDWTIGHPTVDSFVALHFEPNENPAENRLINMTWYICQLALYRRDFVSTPPSVMARCALTLVRGMFDQITDEDTEIIGHPIFVQLTNLIHGEKSEVLVKKFYGRQYQDAAYMVETYLLQQAEAERQAEAARQAELQRQADAQRLAEAEAQRRASWTPQEALRNMSSIANPHTPIKRSIDSRPAHGYMTPPITPDEFTRGCVSMWHPTVAKGTVFANSTLTPPSSNPSRQVSAEVPAQWPQPPASNSLAPQAPWVAWPSQQNGGFPS